VSPARGSWSKVQRPTSFFSSSQISQSTGISSSLSLAIAKEEEPEKKDDGDRDPNEPQQTAGKHDELLDAVGNAASVT